MEQIVLTENEFLSAKHIWYREQLLNEVNPILKRSGSFVSRVGIQACHLFFEQYIGNVS